MEPLDFNFLKDRYDHELARKEQLTAALGLPVGVLGGLGSLLAVMVRSFGFQNDATTWAFGFTIVPAISCFFGCLLQLVRAYHRQTCRCSRTSKRRGRNGGRSTGTLATRDQMRTFSGTNCAGV
jgi:hypothetical protein